MKRAESDNRRPFSISRLILTAAPALFIAGTGLTLQTRSLASEDASRSGSSAFNDARSEQERLQGKWRIVRCEFSGRDEPQPVGVEDSIRGDKWLRPNRRTAEYQFKLDPTKDPKWVDLSAERLGAQTLKGIYLLDGDRLTICYAYDPGSPRPTEFKTMRDSHFYLYVLERVSKD
jgi:uncharacterized protein (TIGR03067 family)